MLVFNYHPETRQYVGSSLAPVDPMELELARAAVFDPPATAARTAYRTAVAAAGQIADEVGRAAALDAAGQALEQALAEARALADQVEPQHWLTPAHCTTQEPPAFDFDQNAYWRDGAWVIEDAPQDETEPEPTEADLAAAARHERNRRIEALRPLIERHRDEVALGLTTTWTNEDYLMVLQHIQELRDVPEQDGFPMAFEWPTLPPELIATG